MSSIAILGSGRVAKVLAGGLSSAGHDVVIGSRNPAETTAAWEGPGVEIVSVPDAVSRAEIVINATPGDSAVDRLAALRAELAGKVLIDVSNATTRGADGAPRGIQPAVEFELQQHARHVPSLRTVTPPSSGDAGRR